MRKLQVIQKANEIKMFSKSDNVYHSLLKINVNQQIEEVTQIFRLVSKQILINFQEAMVKKNIIKGNDQYQIEKHTEQIEEDITKRGDKIMVWMKNNITQRYSTSKYEQDFQNKVVKIEELIRKISLFIQKISQKKQKETINKMKQNLKDEVKQIRLYKSSLDYRLKRQELDIRFFKNYQRIIQMHNSFKKEIKTWKMKIDQEGKENNQDTANLKNSQSQKFICQSPKFIYQGNK